MTWGNIYTKRVNWPVKPRNAYLRDLEQIHLKKRKLEHEREENEANVKREMMREMLLKEKNERVHARRRI